MIPSLLYSIEVRICQAMDPYSSYAIYLLAYVMSVREEHRLRVFENRVLRRIFGPKRDEVTGEWRKLHNEELHDLYSSPSIIRMKNA
jgi:hypothetical protein